MATFTWAHGTTADWNVTNDWSAKKGTIPPPGSTSADIDTATLGSDKTAYAVTVSLGETFDIAALNISGDSESATTGLTIAGALYTDTVTYGGDGNDAPITVSDGGLLDIRNGISAPDQETVTISGTGSGGQLEFGSASTSGIRINDTGVTLQFQQQLRGSECWGNRVQWPDLRPRQHGQSGDHQCRCRRQVRLRRRQLHQ